MYGGYDSIYHDINPGEERVIVVTFDVPEDTKSLLIAPASSFSNPWTEPRFLVANFDQVPAYKPK